MDSFFFVFLLYYSSCIFVHNLVYQHSKFLAREPFLLSKCFDVLRRMCQTDFPRAFSVIISVCHTPRVCPEISHITSVQTRVRRRGLMSSTGLASCLLSALCLRGTLRYIGCMRASTRSSSWSDSSASASRAIGKLSHD